MSNVDADNNMPHAPQRPPPIVTDGACALLAGMLAVQIRFVSQGYLPLAYLACTGVLPAWWWVCGRPGL